LKSKRQKKNTGQSNTKQLEHIIDDRGGNDLLNPPVATTEVIRFNLDDLLSGKESLLPPRRIFDVIHDFYFYHIHWNVIDLKKWIRVKLFPKKYSRAHMFTSFKDTEWHTFEDVVPEALGRWFLDDYPNYLLGTPASRKALDKAQQWFVLRPMFITYRDYLDNMHIFDISDKTWKSFFALQKSVYNFIEEQDTIHLTALIKYRGWVTD
jgi:hypothetical protein